MKRYMILVAAAALALTACTVESLNTSKRTAGNLASFAGNLNDAAADANVFAMHTIIKNADVWPDMWEEGWDTTMTNQSGLKIKIVKEAPDSLWSIWSNDPNSSIQIEALIRMLKDDEYKKHNWNYTVTGTYNEGKNDGLLTDFMTEGGMVKYFWYKYETMYDTEYYMVKKGVFKTETTFNGNPLDWCKLNFTGTVDGTKAETSQD